ncbi:MAG: hypothetical protein HPY45_17855 [Anaerolineae bacterium]|nr:hypothetical protein [Anaerolineae bacterium]
MTRRKTLIALWLALLLALFSAVAVLADDNGGFSDDFDDSGSGGGCNNQFDSFDYVEIGGEEAGSSGSSSDSFYCPPGTSQSVQAYRRVPGTNNKCLGFGGTINCDTNAVTWEGLTGGQDLGGGVTEYLVDCIQGNIGGIPGHPCKKFSGSSSGFACETWNWGFRLSASVNFPGWCLDLRPFPATLVSWPTAARFSCAGSASGSDSVAYVPKGGGSPADPSPGDWSNVVFSLILRPFTPTYAFVSLPNVLLPPLPLVSDTSPPYFFTWEKSSHPAAGGGPTAGTISGLEELPADIPVYVGNARAPYVLFWELQYDEWVEVWEEVCTRPDESGHSDCHEELVDEYWEHHVTGGPIHPLAVQVASSLRADLNGDGSPEGYWNYSGLNIRRMNDANRVTDPVWRRTWNWGGKIYWAVREGQGQIGWVD